MNESDTDANTKAIDSLLNFETVKYFGAEEREAARYDQLDGALRAAERQDLRLAGGAQHRPGGHLRARHDRRAGDVRRAASRRVATTIGDFVLLNAMMLQLYQPLNFMGMVYRDIKQAIVDIERMFGILGEQPGYRATCPARSRSRSAHGEVRFENVDFAYDPSAADPARRSFEAPAGRTVAIVGPSGAGKSTISRLLFRFYEPSRGRIRSTARTSRDVTQTALRAAIGMVPQDTVLFNDTILYNIRYGRDDATEEEVEGGGEDAQIDAFIRSLPHGYDSHGRRARAETLRRREAARRHRPHDAEGAADPAARRGDLGARQLHRARDPGGAGAGVEGAHDASSSPTGSRPSSTPTRSWCSTRASSPSAAPTTRCWRAAALRRPVEPPARGRRRRGGAAARRRRRPRAGRGAPSGGALNSRRAASRS